MPRIPSSTPDIGRARSVRTASAAVLSPFASRATSPNACFVAWRMTGDIFTIERIPAAKMPPIPIGRTYSKKMSSAGIWASGTTPPAIAPGTQWPR